MEFAQNATIFLLAAAVFDWILPRMPEVKLRLAVGDTDAYLHHYNARRLIRAPTIALGALMVGGAVSTDDKHLAMALAIVSAVPFLAYSVLAIVHIGRAAQASNAE